MSTLEGFLSYVHADDDAEGGRITQLAHDIAGQFAMISGEDVHIFLDRDDLEWGSEWSKRIDQSLATVAFFIPIVTPRYLASAACRSELNTFARRSADVGVPQLLLPIHYVSTRGIDEPDGDDELLALLASRQWIDWRELRFAGRRKGRYRSAVAGLAERLVNANRDIEEGGVSLPVVPSDEPQGPDADGVVETMARFEGALPALTETTAGIAEAIGRIGEEVAVSGEQIQLPNNQTFARRLVLLRELAARLSEPAKKISTLADDFTQQLHDMDRGVRLVLERVPLEPENHEEFVVFAGSLRGLIANAEVGLAQVQTLSDSAAPLESMSRDIRPALRDMRRGLSLIGEGIGVMKPWEALIEAAGL